MQISVVINMELDKFARLHEEIQKGIADLMADRVRPGKQVLDDLAFRLAVNEGLAEIQAGKTLSLDEVKKHLNLKNE